MAERHPAAGLPLFNGGAPAVWPRFEAGAPFWRAVETLVPADLLAGQLDELLAGATAPRVWLLLHEPGQPHLSAAAALMLARALVGRGQNVVVLDADEAGAALTIWTEREETEGWIDVARFGASVHGAGVALPFRGGRGTLLGIGSFVPTDATEDEIASLVGRLRHQADDILIVAAVGPAAVPWARRAERRLFCWDQAARDAAQLGPVCGPFAAAGVPLTGLIGYGMATAAAAVSPVAPQAESQAEPQAVAAMPAPTVPPVAAVRAAAPASQARTVPPVPEATRAPGAPPLPVGVEGDLAAEPELTKGTPRVFWLAAAVFGLALISITWYWTNYVRVPPGGYFEPVATPTLTDSLSVEPATTTAASGDADSLVAEAATAPDPRVAQAGSPVSSGDTLPASPAAPVAAGHVRGSAARTDFERAPYTVPAGQAGWALHVYSLPDSAGAAAEVAALELAGFRTAVRIVEIPERGGRWWRVCVGSFANRAAAQAAMPALLRRLNAEWAEPVRLREPNR